LVLENLTLENFDSSPFFWGGFFWGVPLDRLSALNFLLQKKHQKDFRQLLLSLTLLIE
jgi:hypothetical protein